METEGASDKRRRGRPPKDGKDKKVSSKRKDKSNGGKSMNIAEMFENASQRTNTIEENGKYNSEESNEESEELTDDEIIEEKELMEFSESENEGEQESNLNETIIDTSHTRPCTNEGTGNNWRSDESNNKESRDENQDKQTPTMKESELDRLKAVMNSIKRNINCMNCEQKKTQEENKNIKELIKETIADAVNAAQCEWRAQYTILTEELQRQKLEAEKNKQEWSKKEREMYEKIRTLEAMTGYTSSAIREVLSDSTQEPRHKSNGNHNEEVVSIVQSDSTADNRRIPTDWTPKWTLKSTNRAGSQTQNEPTGQQTSGWETPQTRNQKGQKQIRTQRIQTGQED